MSAKRFDLKTRNRVDGCAGKRDSQLKPVAAFDLICVIYLLPIFFKSIGIHRISSKFIECHLVSPAGVQASACACFPGGQCGGGQCGSPPYANTTGG
jgi:hypothetical protein